MQRLDKREFDELRPTTIETKYTKYAEGSVLISVGDTKVLCTATIEDNVPSFKKNSGEGWVTAEYSMLPRATQSRNHRDIHRLKQSPRSIEIQRLIGRSLRAAVDLKLLGDRSITIDCDVIQADGGTRTAAITGGFVALCEAVNLIYEKKLLKTIPIKRFISAVSVGIVENYPMLDLCYTEDARAVVDMNVISTDESSFVELQGTGENGVFSREELNILLDLAQKGNSELMNIQKLALPYDWCANIY